MRIASWGMVVLGVYLIIAGLISFNILSSLAQINGILAVIAGVLILIDHWKR